MLVEGPAELVVRGPNAVFCSLGKVSTTVPPEGKGFKIDTHYASIVDLGTQFSMNADAEKTDIHVVKGLVEVSRNQSEKYNIVEGQAIAYDQRGQVKLFEASLDTFITATNWLERLGRHLERRKAVREKEQEQLVKDPNLLARLDDSTPYGVRQVPGYCEDSKALRFRSTRDYASLSMPGSHRNMTLLATVRMDDMKNTSNLICLENSLLDSPGGFSWQVDSRGAILFHIHADDKIRRFDTKPLIRRSDWRTWLTLAVVVDADRKEISHYMDGKKVASFPWENPRPLHLTEGSVGNYLPTRKDRSVRFWNGDIDSLYIYSRPFSEAELKTVLLDVQ